MVLTVRYMIRFWHSSRPQNCPHEDLYEAEYLAFVGQVTPKFCKMYSKVGEIVQAALSEYNQEVSERVFPALAHSPYRLGKDQLEPFLKELQNRGFHDAAEAAHGAADKELEADRSKAVEKVEEADRLKAKTG